MSAEADPSRPRRCLVDAVFAQPVPAAVDLGGERVEARARVAELCELYRLAAEQRRRLEALLELLARDPRAPTSVRDPAAAADVHLADSLVALSLPGVAGAGDVVDLGAGAGFPGLPLAVALPHATVRLLEANARKCDFLRDAVAALDVGNVRVVCDRAESWIAGLGASDLVVARAVASQAVVLEYAAPLLSLDGILVEWRGQRDAAGERDGAAAAARLGMRPRAVERATPFRGAQNHHLHVFVKDSPTPAGFPRRPGVARKRPLSAAPPESR
ncbi:MAG: 16S rRNA (guanine(527)-N(7))-methyltransferase RsmG [Solirubrobacteraceae bacterium]